MSATKRPALSATPVAPVAKRPAYSSEAVELESALQRAKQEAWDARLRARVGGEHERTC